MARRPCCTRARVYIHKSIQVYRDGRYGRKQQRLRMPRLERGGRGRRRPSRRFLRRRFGVRHRRHGIRGQSSDRKITPVVPGPEDHLPVDQAETGQGHTVPVPGAAGKSGKYSRLRRIYSYTHKH